MKRKAKRSYTRRATAAPAIAPTLLSLHLPIDGTNPDATSRMTALVADFTNLAASRGLRFTSAFGDGGTTL